MQDCLIFTNKRIFLELTLFSLNCHSSQKTIEIFKLIKELSTQNQEQLIFPHKNYQMPKGKQNKKKIPTKTNDPGKKQLINICKNTQDIDEILKFTQHEDPDIRLEACKQLCPCKVLQDIDEFWERVFQMADDQDARIRSRVLHIICDGSPARLQDKVYGALQKFNYDKDSDIRRTTHKVMATYERTGKWNIL